MDDARARELLARERARVEQSLADLESGAGANEELSNLDQHPADNASELYQREQDEGLAIRLKDELAAIERAERRLAEGSYGTSIDSGDPIPDERLEVMPWAERTVEEQQRYERGGV